MPKIRIKNFDFVLKNIQRGEGELAARLHNEYAKAIAEAGQEIAQQAAINLNKPNWILSKAIKASRTKFYEDKHVFFKAVEPESNRDPQPNTPAFYAFYQENGYVVQLNKVSRPRQNKIINTKRGKGKASYRKSEGLKFFKRASESAAPKLRDKIKQINQTILKEVIK